MSEATSDEDLSFDGPVSARPVAAIQAAPLSLDDDAEFDADEEDGLQIIDFDDEEPTQPLSPLPTNYEYRDWRHEDTKVLTYTTAPELYPKDRPTTSLASARAEVEKVHGRILETNQVPHRYFFRVLRTLKVL